MEKNLNYYMGLNYPVTVEIFIEDGEKYYSVEIPDLPGCGSYGATLEEAFERLEDSKELWLEESLKRDLDISEPVSEEDFSGKFLLRIPSRLHMKITKNAKANNVSLNQYVKSLLEQSETYNKVLIFLEKSNRKLLRILDTQSHHIYRLEKRIESLEHVLSSQHPPMVQHRTDWETDSSTTVLARTYSSDVVISASTDPLEKYCITSWSDK